MDSHYFLSVKQPPGEIRRCERDGTVLSVSMMVTSAELDDDLWEVYMECPECRALYVEVGPVSGGRAG